MCHCAPEAVMSFFFSWLLQNIYLSIYLCIYLGGCRWGSQGWRALPTGFRCEVRLALIECVCCALFIWSMNSPDFSRGFICAKLLQCKSLVLTWVFLYLSGSSTLTSPSQIYSCWMGGYPKEKRMLLVIGKAYKCFEHLLPQDNSGLHRRLLEMCTLSRKEQCRGPFRRKEKRHLAAWEIDGIIHMGASSSGKPEPWINSLC